MKRMVLALALSTIAAGPIMAAQPAANTTGAAGNGAILTQGQAGQWRASKLIGVNIYSSANENIGEVNEILLGQDGTVQGVVVGVGGFLGIGEKNVAISFKDVKWMNQAARSASNANPPVNNAVPGANNANPVVPATPNAGTDVTGSVNTALRDYPDHGVVAFTKDQLKAMPDFHYASEMK